MSLELITNIERFDKLKELEYKGLYGYMPYFNYKYIELFQGVVSLSDLEVENFRLSLYNADTYMVLRKLKFIDADLIDELQNFGKYTCPYFGREFNGCYPLALIGKDIFKAIKSSINPNDLPIQRQLAFRPSIINQLNLERTFTPGRIGLSTIGHGFYTKEMEYQGNGNWVAIKVKINENISLVLYTFLFKEN